MNKPLFRQLASIALAIGLLYYVLKDVPLTELARQFRRANYYWLALVGILISLYHLTRALRWQLTLQALGYRPSLFRTVIALLAGTLASMIVPGAGELTRCGTLQRTDGVPIAQGIGSVVAERVIDLVMLALLIGLTLLLAFDRVGQYIVNLLAPLQDRFALFSRSGVLAGVLVMGLAILAGILYGLARQEVIRQHTLTRRLLGIGRDVGQGFMGIRQLQQPGLFVTLTVLSNVWVFLITYVLFFASPQTTTLPPTAALTVLTVSSLGGLAVPTQGGLGTYHFLVSRVLMLYGLNETGAVITATFLHAVQMGFSLLLSSLSFFILPLLLRQRHSPTPDQSVYRR
ncbi:lysylphosphatidylglycerol synthase transmembrane domain-containing protein [Spirosoma rigui]|uniref:lysylphosphatidylglycerol synthase transmembrane domain-containing protein n=1 Tax=Spirosoma rigui TaxID=564064 RepID=UPI0009AF3CDE|nr:lysylphosphatidylglycerol synthase transmembrane domain-containing protein [Spirosoma rigui]